MKSPAPAAGEWVLLAEVPGRRPVLLLGVDDIAGGLSWSSYDVDEAACWLLRLDADVARRAERARRGRLRIRVVRRAEAAALVRWARFGVLTDLRAG